jgi:hypothetical protein
MPTPVPSNPSAVPTAPDRTDRATFSARATAFFDYIKNTMWGELTAWVNNAYTNAVDALASAVAAASSAAAALASQNASAANASAAAASAGATAWNAGTAYTLGQRAIDPTNQRLYFRRVAGTTGTQPNADPTNWGPLDISEVIIPVTGTTGTVFAGATYRMSNAAQTSLTLDAALADSAEFAVVLANGRIDNSLDIGGRTLFGPAGNFSGVVVFDTQVRLWSFKFHAPSNSLEII